jgi:putative endonuclease
MVKCVDESFYTGWTKDPIRRAKQHNNGRGAKYTRLHRPVLLVYVEEQPDLSSAMKRERAIKRMSHLQKMKIADQYSSNSGMISEKDEEI